MTKYKEIIGTDIEVVTSDPTVTGQVWYNESEGELKTRNQFVGTAWSTGGSLNTARNSMASSILGTQTSGIVAGGDGPGTPELFAGTENYNGSSWTEVNDLNTARRQLQGAGTATSALAMAGNLNGPFTNVVESWNGSSWTEVADLSVARQQGMTAGESNTAALYTGGENPTPTVLKTNELWNGSAWTESGDMNIIRRNGNLFIFSKFFCFLTWLNIKCY